MRRIIAAQPLAPASKSGQLEPRPLLTPSEASAAAVAFYRDAVGFTLQALADVPADELAAGERGEYTHVLHVTLAPEHACRHYLVRVEEEVPTSVMGFYNNPREDQGAECASAEAGLFRLLRDSRPDAPPPLPGESVNDYMRRLGKQGGAGGGVP